MEDIQFYFAYGSNMNPMRVERRKVKFISAEAATLKNFFLSFNKKSAVYPGAASANIMHLDDSSAELGSYPKVLLNQGVEGVLYKLKNAEQIFAMDPFEGYPVRYNRVEVNVHTHNGSEKTWTYMANSEYISDGLKPNKWYLDHLLSGHEYLSPSYLEALQKIPTLPNSNIEP